jgi:hypothetical protein
VVSTELVEQWEHLLLAEVGVEIAEPSDLFEDPMIPETSPPCPRSAGARVEGVELSLPLSQFPFPQKEGATLHGEGVHRRRESVLRPEVKDLRATERVLYDHIPKAYHTLPGADPPFGAPKLVEDSHFSLGFKECKMYVALCRKIIHHAASRGETSPTSSATFWGGG